jgi:hypothetical protein
MKAEKAIERPRMQRRRLLGLLGGLGILGFVWPGASRPARRPRELSLKEADFYRPHDLAG